MLCIHWLTVTKEREEAETMPVPVYVHYNVHVDDVCVNFMYKHVYYYSIEFVVYMYLN